MEQTSQDGAHLPTPPRAVASEAVLTLPLALSSSGPEVLCQEEALDGP